MSNEHRKLCFYVDESGQETRGEFFLVSVVVSPAQHLESLRERLVQLERLSKKGKHRWANTSRGPRGSYLEGLPPLLAQIAPVYWRQYGDGKDYPRRTGEAIVAATKRRDPDGLADLTVLIDGCNWEELQAITKVFRAHNIRRRKIRGGRDEGEPLLRLADALAGFIRDVTEGNPSALLAWKNLDIFFQEV